MDWKSEAARKNKTYTEAGNGRGAAVPVFAPIVMGGLEFIESLPPKIEVPTGTDLIEQDQPVKAISVIQSGLVKLVYVSASGQEITLGLRSVGWFAGSVSALLNTQNVYTVRTVTPCVISRIPAHDFSLKLMQSAKLMRHFLTTLCYEVISQAGAQAQVMSSGASERLSSFITECNTKHPKWKTMDPLPMLKQMELAQLLSITPEHLSRLLHRKPEGCVQESVGRTA